MSNRFQLACHPKDDRPPSKSLGKSHRVLDEAKERVGSRRHEHHHDGTLESPEFYWRQRIVEDYTDGLSPSIKIDFINTNFKHPNTENSSATFANDFSDAVEAQANNITVNKEILEINASSSVSASSPCERRIFMKACERRSEDSSIPIIRAKNRASNNPDFHSQVCKSNVDAVDTREDRDVEFVAEQQTNRRFHLGEDIVVQFTNSVAATRSDDSPREESSNAVSTLRGKEYVCAYGEDLKFGPHESKPLDITIEELKASDATDLTVDLSLSSVDRPANWRLRYDTEQTAVYGKILFSVENATPQELNLVSGQIVVKAVAKQCQAVGAAQVECCDIADQSRNDGYLADNEESVSDVEVEREHRVYSPCLERIGQCIKILDCSEDQLRGGGGGGASELERKVAVAQVQMVKTSPTDDRRNDNGSNAPPPSYLRIKCMKSLLHDNAICTSENINSAVDPVEVTKEADSLTTGINVAVAFPALQFIFVDGSSSSRATSARCKTGERNKSNSVSKGPPEPQKGASGRDSLSKGPPEPKKGASDPSPGSSRSHEQGKRSTSHSYTRERAVPCKQLVRNLCPLKFDNQHKVKNCDGVHEIPKHMCWGKYCQHKKDHSDCDPHFDLPSSYKQEYKNKTFQRRLQYLEKHCEMCAAMEATEKRIDTHVSNRGTNEGKNPSSTKPHPKPSTGKNSAAPQNSGRKTASNNQDPQSKSVKRKLSNASQSKEIDNQCSKRPRTGFVLRLEAKKILETDMPDIAEIIASVEGGWSFLMGNETVRVHPAQHVSYRRFKVINSIERVVMDKLSKEALVTFNVKKKRDFESLKVGEIVAEIRNV